MKSMFQIAFLWVAVGCASAPTKQPANVAAIVKDPTSHIQIIPQSLRLVDSKSGCPKTIQTVKGQNWKAALQMANACVLARQWAMVETIGTHLAETENRSPWGAFFLSLAAESRNELARANWMAELALKKAPKNGLLQYQKGRLLWLAGERIEALKELKASIESEPKLVDAHVLLGQVAFEESDFKRAASYFQKALSLEGSHLGALMGMAEISVINKDLKSAGEFFATAVAQHPFNAQARLRQAVYLETLEKNLPEALSSFKRIKVLVKDKRLDAQVEMDLDSKIQQLEIAVRDINAKQLSLRDPAESKKVKK